MTDSLLFFNRYPVSISWTLTVFSVRLVIVFHAVVLPLHVSTTLTTTTTILFIMNHHNNLIGNPERTNAYKLIKNTNLLAFRSGEWYCSSSRISFHP
jgi:hypothetical protein